VGAPFNVIETPQGEKMLSIDEVYVCPECGSFASPQETRWGCEGHPGVPPALRHITVSDPYLPVNFNKSTVRPVKDPRVAKWRENYQANAACIGDSVYDLPHKDVIYLVGCGSSLEINGHLLRHVDKRNSAIIVLNDALNWVLNADYFLCMDYAFQNTLGNRNCTAILAPVVRNELVRKPWKDVRWIRSSSTGSPFDEVHKRHPDLWVYDEGLNCSYTAFQLIAQIFDPKALVLVGLDCGFSLYRERIGKPLVYAEKEIYEVHRGLDGSPVLSNSLYGRVARFTSAVLGWFQKHGCQVVNANADGLLPQDMTVQSVQTVAPMTPLMEVVKTANAKGTNNGS